MLHAPPIPIRKTATRFGFVDLLRGFALIVMIETHVINAYLPYALRQSEFFFWLTYFNGLVAPTFLFASGFSIILQASKYWDDWLHFRPSFWRQMRRLGFITLVAYYSHVGPFKLSKYLNPDHPGIWRDALQVDILQCIVASLLLVHFLIILLYKPERVAWGAIVLAVYAAVATPWMWAQDFTVHFPLSLALFMNPHGISLFPLFPWTCFLLAGTVAAHFFLGCAAQGRERSYMRIACALGVLMILCGLLLRYIPWTLPGLVSFYTTSPLYVLIRLGSVLIICALWFVWEKSGLATPRAVRLAGQESLLVYGVHLWVIFGLLRGKELGPLIGFELGYGKCFLLSGCIIALMLALAALWHFLKKEYPRVAKPAQAITVVIMLLVFLLR